MAKYKFIVKKGNEFLTEEHNTKPANFVMARYNYIQSLEEYKLVDKSIDFSWKRYSLLTIKHKDQVIDSYKTDNLQLVCDFLNKYNKMTEQEIEKLYLESQNQTKTELEEEIDNLKAEKQQLEEEVEIYRKIKKKQEELNELMAQLENTNEEKE